MAAFEGLAALIHDCSACVPGSEIVSFLEGFQRRCMCWSEALLYGAWASAHMKDHSNQLLLTIQNSGYIHIRDPSIQLRKLSTHAQGYDYIMGHTWLVTPNLS